MSSEPANITETTLPATVANTLPVVATEAPLVTTTPPRQLSELPKDELEAIAEDFGLDGTRYKTQQLLVAAIHERRQLIATMNRSAMIDIVRWGRRPVSVSASKEQIAQEIARIRSMRFSGLSHEGLIILAQLRGIPVNEKDTVPILVKKLRRKEGLFSKLGRKKRAFLGSMVAKMIGESDTGGEYQFLPPTSQNASGVIPPSSSSTIKQDIEDSGLIGGLTNRLKKSADSYVNQKLDEIEARIDRKLDEIDRRLAEWRDKEIANRIRILKITLWASVIVGAVSLLYAYMKENFPGLFH